MVSHPDAHPDSTSPAPSEDVERVVPASDDGRDSVEDTPGSDGGTSGTGGTNHRQDTDITS